jgi:hypothetical protein
MSKTPEELAEEYRDTQANIDSFSVQKAFLAGYKAGCEVTDQEIVDLIVDIRKREEEERNKLPADKEQRYARIWEKIKVKMIGIF